MDESTVEPSAPKLVGALLEAQITNKRNQAVFKENSLHIDKNKTFKVGSKFDVIINDVKLDISLINANDGFNYSYFGESHENITPERKELARKNGYDTTSVAYYAYGEITANDYINNQSGEFEYLTNEEPQQQMVLNVNFDNKKIKGYYGDFKLIEAKITGNKFDGIFTTERTRGGITSDDITTTQGQFNGPNAEEMAGYVHMSSTIKKIDEAQLSDTQRERNYSVGEKEEKIKVFGAIKQPPQ